jgi:DNA topoisomerase-1
MMPYRLEGADAQLPHLKENDGLQLTELRAIQHFTQPPPRFNEASLVRTLESLGIGRPSTYASIISTIQDRGYVTKDDGRFHPTSLGTIVTNQLMEHFPRIMDVQFTSHMEEQLDKIEEAHLDWIGVLNEFYQPFNESLDKAAEAMNKQAVASEYDCPLCQKKLVYRWTKSGQFLACEGYPECKYSTSVDSEGKPQKKEMVITDHACPACGKPMALRSSRFGPFLGCTGYPDCKTTMPCDKEGTPLRRVKPEEVTGTCPECGKPMVAKKGRGRKGGFLACTGYPTCKETLPIPEDIAIDWPAAVDSNIKCPKCGQPMLIRRSRRGPFLGCKGFPKCRTTMPMPKEDGEDVAKEAQGS